MQAGKLLGMHLRGKNATKIYARYMSSDVRNIGIMAHIDAGKTTTTERMLYLCGATQFMGNVDTGNTVTDYLPSERNRGITVQSAAVTMHWDDSTLNLIDTPGHVDFTVEVERALHVLDGGVAVIDAARGVEAQTKTVWKQANKLNIPKIVFINKMDKAAASYAAAVRSVENLLDANTFVTQLPVGEGSSFKGVIDVVDMERYEWIKPSSEIEPDGSNFTRCSLTENDEDDHKHALIIREKLIEKLADLYDEVADLWLEKYKSKPENFPSSLLQKFLKQATIENKAVPVLCGSASNKIGIQPLLDAIVDYLPCPEEVKNTELAKYDFPSDLLIAYAFKVVHHREIPLVFTRLYSGEILSDSKVYNASKDEYEKDIKLYKVFANEYQPKKHLHNGQIVAIGGLKHTSTGDVLLSNKDDLSLINPNYQSGAHLNRQEILSPVAIHEPVFFCTIEANSMSQQKALENALDIICKEDPSVHVHTDQEYGQKILSGMGELHIEVIFERLTKEFKVDCYIGPLKVAYRETPTQDKYITDQYERTITGKKHVINMTMELNSEDKQRKIKIELPHNIHKNLKKILTNGIRHACYSGPVMGYPVVGGTINIKEIESVGRSPPAVMTAAVTAITKSLLREANCMLLEPIMKIDIVTTADYVDNTLESLGNRRATVSDVSSENHEYTVTGTAPVAEMLGYAKALRIKTSGNADLSMHVGGYKKLNNHEMELLKKKQI